MASPAELRLPDCFESDLLRVRYFPRQLLTVDDMKVGQDYEREKQRRHNRLLHGWGSVCGLEVFPDPIDEAPWRVRIGEGHALGPYGDQINLEKSVFLDLALCGPGAATDPCDPELLRRPSSAEGQEVFVAIKYAECLARPVRAAPAGCACDEEACEYSRIRDSFQLECLTELPPSHVPAPGPSLCDIVQGRQLPVCPPCPTEPWVVLAQVNLPVSPTTNIADSNIDNFTFRRLVFSTAVLQDQLIRCCCLEESADLSIAISTTAVNVIDTAITAQYLIDVTNNGPSVATGIAVTSRLAATNGIVGSASAFTDEWTNTELPVPRSSTAEFTAQIPQLEAQAAITLAFNVTIAGDGPVAVVHTAEVTSETLDPNPRNNREIVRIPADPDPSLPI